MTKPHMGINKTESEEEEEVHCDTALCTNDSMSLRQLNKNTPDKNVHDISQNDASINENSTENLFNDEAITVQGQTNNNNKIESQ